MNVLYSKEIKFAVFGFCNESRCLKVAFHQEIKDR